jgi:hypothetical protein
MNREIATSTVYAFVILLVSTSYVRSWPWLLGLQANLFSAYIWGFAGLSNAVGNGGPSPTLNRPEQEADY